MVGESVSDVRKKMEEERLEKELKVQKLQDNISELERVIQERKRRRASLVDKTLAGTSVLGAELERLRLLPDEDHKSKFVCSLTYGHKNIRQSEKTFDLSDVLSNRQAEFEREQESQAFFIAKLRGQQVNARSSLRDFRRDFRQDRGGDAETEQGEGDDGEDGPQAPKPASVLRKFEKKLVGDNFRLRCLRSELQAFKSALGVAGSGDEGDEATAGAAAVGEDEARSAPHNEQQLTLENVDKADLYLVSSILTEVVESSLEEAQKREALLALRDRGGSNAMTDNTNALIHSLGRSITNELLQEVVRDVSEETWREIQLSYEEARHFASQLVSSALTNEQDLRQFREQQQEKGERSSGNSASGMMLTSRRARKCLSSVLNGMSEHFEAYKLFSGNPLFRDFTSGGSNGEGSQPKQAKMNLEPKHQRESDTMFKDREEDFWSNVQLESSQTKVEPTSSKSQLSCMQTSGDGKYLAAGSFSGELFVWNLQSNAQPVLYSAAPKRKGKSKNEVLSLCWSRNHLQVCAFFEDGSLSVHKVKEKPTPEQRDKDKAESDDEDEDDDDNEDQIAFLSAPQVCKSSKSLDRQPSQASYSESVKVFFAFHPSVTTSGFCPRLVVPSTCGDVTMITMDQGDLYRGAARARRLKPDEQTKDFLSRPLKPCKAGIKQVLCHGHSEPVIFAGYSERNSNLVTVDTAGEISIWSCNDSKRTGFGWYVPDQTWKTNLNVSTLKALERIPVDLEEEGQVAAADLEVANMKRWLTSYRYVGSKKNMTPEHQVIHVPKGVAKGRVTAYLSSYSLPGNSLKERTKVNASWVKVPGEACAVSFTSQNQELVLFTKAKPMALESEEEDSVEDHFSIFVVCLNSGVLKTPRIDVPLAEEDGPPAFALSKTIPLLGSDYLYVGIGCNHVGVFSLATGFMVKDIEIALPSSASILELSLIDSTYTSTKDMLCCRCFSPSEKVKLYFFDVSDQVALEACLEQRDPRKLDKVDREGDAAEEELEEEEIQSEENLSELEELEEVDDDGDLDQEEEEDVGRDQSEQEDNEGGEESEGSEGLESEEEDTE